MDPQRALWVFRSKALLLLLSADVRRLCADKVRERSRTTARFQSRSGPAYRRARNHSIHRWIEVSKSGGARSGTSGSRLPDAIFTQYPRGGSAAVFSLRGL